MGGNNQKSVEMANNQQLLLAAVGSMPYGFSVWNDDFSLELFNQSFLDIYGLSKDVIAIGSTLYDICECTTKIGNHPGWSVEGLYASLKLRLVNQKQGDDPGKFEQIIGERSIRTSIVRQDDIGWIVSHEDISEDVLLRKHSQKNEKRLLSQTVLFERAINSMLKGLCAFDGEKNLIICNRTYASLYNLPENLTRPGTSFLDIMRHRIESGIIPEGETAESHFEHRMSMVDSKHTQMEFTETENGRSLNIIKNPVPGGGWIGVVHDVTEELEKEDLIKQRSEEIRLQNLRFAAAVQHMVQGLAMFDANRRLVICNDKWQKLYDLPDNLTKPGTTYEEIIVYCMGLGMVVETDDKQKLDNYDDIVAVFDQKNKIFVLSDGRFISVSCQPMEDGGFVSTHEDVTERRLNEERIKYLARHDSLTQLPNRTYFNEEMAKAEAKIARGEKMALLCLDLDNFKEINDTYGHGIGDEVLCQVAARLNNGKRKSELVARMGGDEFMYLAMPVEGNESAKTIASRILANMARPMEIEGYEIIVGTSIGIAMAPTDGTDSATLIKHADMALFRAKKQGRCGFQFFTNGMDIEVQQRKELEADLNGALDKGQFKNLYQPVLELQSNRVSCCTVSLIWERPERSTIMPEEFLPIASEMGIVNNIYIRSMRNACAIIKDWPQATRFCVGMSAGQISSSRVEQRIEDLLQSTGADPNRVELQIEEVALTKNTAEKFKVLRKFRAMGLRISMVISGGGYSALSTMGIFPFDKFVVGGDLIAELESVREKREIVKAIISLGSNLGMITTAVGVENEAQLDILREFGCDEVQGYLFSPPLPQHSIGELLQTIETRAASEAGIIETNIRQKRSLDL